MANYGTKKHWTIGRRVMLPDGVTIGTIARYKEGKGRYLDPFDPRGASLYFVRIDGVKRLARYMVQDCTMI